MSNPGPSNSATTNLQPILGSFDNYGNLIQAFGPNGVLIQLTNLPIAFTSNSATYSINSDVYNYVEITGQTAAITGFTMTGNPQRGARLIIRITGTGSVGITWGSQFESSTVTLPTTTSGTAMLSIGFLWNVATSKWTCVAVA